MAIFDTKFASGWEAVARLNKELRIRRDRLIGPPSFEGHYGSGTRIRLEARNQPSTGGAEWICKVKLELFRNRFPVRLSLSRRTGPEEAGNATKQSPSTGNAEIDRQFVVSSDPPGFASSVFGYIEANDLMKLPSSIHVSIVEDQYCWWVAATYAGVDHAPETLQAILNILARINTKVSSYY